MAGSKSRAQSVQLCRFLEGVEIFSHMDVEQRERVVDKLTEETFDEEDRCVAMACFGTCNHNWDI
eukprot:COSAG05_NODE_1715_length_4227_cov_2.194525_8_plen_65_part_00